MEAEKAFSVQACAGHTGKPGCLDKGLCQELLKVGQLQKLEEGTGLHRDLAPILVLVEGAPVYPMHTQGPGEEAMSHFLPPSESAKAGLCPEHPLRATAGSERRVALPGVL